MIDALVVVVSVVVGLMVPEDAEITRALEVLAVVAAGLSFVLNAVSVVAACSVSAVPVSELGAVVYGLALQAMLFLYEWAVDTAVGAFVACAAHVVRRCLADVRDGAWWCYDDWY